MILSGLLTLLRSMRKEKTVMEKKRQKDKAKRINSSY